MADRKDAQREVVAWGDPPPSRGSGRSSGWAKVARQLRDNPGRWALIDEAASASGLVNHVKQGKIENFRPPGSFEACARRVPDSTPPVDHIYARFVGEPMEVREMRAQTLRDAAARRMDTACCDVYDRLHDLPPDKWGATDVQEYSAHMVCYWACAHAAADLADAQVLSEGGTC